MEKIIVTNPKYQPLRVLWHLFMRPCSKTIPLASIHLFTKQMVPSRIIELKSFDIIDTSFPHAPYKVLASIKNNLCTCRLFFSFHFHCTLFSWAFLWACRNLRKPQKFFINLSFCHSLVCSITLIS